MSFKAIFLPTLFALSFAACASEGQGPTGKTIRSSGMETAAPIDAAIPEDKTIRIGVLLPLSGQFSEVGQSLLNAATMSLFDSGNENILLIARDSKGSAAGATAATEELLAENVHVIVGPLLAPEVRAAHAALTAAGSEIRLIGFSSDRSAAGNGAYLLSFMPEEEVRRVVDYAASQGKKTFAGLIPQTPYGDTVGRAFRAEVTAKGGTVTDYVLYPTNAKAVIDPVKRISRFDERDRAKTALENRLRSMEDPVARASARASAGNPMALPYDALLLPEGAAFMRVIGQLLPYYEINSSTVQLIGTGLWNDQSLSRDPNLQGAWFAAPAQEKARAFLDRYRTLYRHEPPRITTLSYDAVALLSMLAKAGHKLDDRNLTEKEGFTGIDGIFRFRPDGLAERGLAVMTFGPTGITTISPAPTSFD